MHVRIRKGVIPQREDYLVVEVVPNTGNITTSLGFSDLDHAAKAFFRFVKDTGTEGRVEDRDLRGHLEAWQGCIQTPPRQRRQRARAAAPDQNRVAEARSLLEQLAAPVPDWQPWWPRQAGPVRAADQTSHRADRMLGTTTGSENIRRSDSPDSGDSWVQQCLNCSYATRHGSGPLPDSHWRCDNCNHTRG